MNGCGQCLRDCYILMIAVVLMSMILINSNAYTTVYGPTVTLLETLLFGFFLWSVLWKMDIDKLDGSVLLILLNFEPKIEMKSWISFWICRAQKHFASSFQLWHLQSSLWFVCLFVCFFVDTTLKENMLYSAWTVLFDVQPNQGMFMNCAYAK